VLVVAVTETALSAALGGGAAGPAALVVAAIRPGSWDPPLFIHVLGAMVLVGAAAAGVRAAFATDRSQAPDWLRRFGFRSLLLAALPAFVLMRIGAEWMRIKEFGSAPTPTWVTIGYTAADGGGFLLVVAIVLAWLAVRRGRPGFARAAAAIAGLALLGWIVTVWAMGAKPV